jgi:hypothetical protein
VPAAGTFGPMPIRTLRAALIGAALLSIGPAASSADAAALVFFHLPSKNIGCALDGSFLRCDVNQFTNPRPARPKSCDLDYGNAFGLHATGRASRLCVGDTAVDPRSPTLRYGSTWSRGGFTCKASAAGLRCTNRSGHGFFLSRTSQRLF